MNQQIATYRIATLPTQGNLFPSLPRQPRVFKGDMEDECLSPRERRWVQ